jgi:hypothetical protein
MKMASLLEKMLVLEKLDGCGADIHTSYDSIFWKNEGSRGLQMDRRRTTISCSVKCLSQRADTCRCERTREMNREKEVEVWECVKIRELRLKGC